MWINVIKWEQEKTNVRSTKTEAENMKIVYIMLGDARLAKRFSMGLC